MPNKEFIKKLRSSFKNLRKNRLFSPVLKVSCLLLFVIIFYFLLFLGRISPRAYVAGVYLGGKTPEEAGIILSETITQPNQITLVGENQTFDIDLNTIGFSYDFQKSAQAAYELDKTGNIIYDLLQRISLLIEGTNLGLRLNLDEEKLAEVLSVVAGQASVEPTYPSVSLIRGAAVVEKGSSGQELDIDDLRIKIGQNLAFREDSPISLPLVSVDPSLTDEEAENLRKRAEGLIGKSLFIEFEYQTYTYKENDIFKFLEPRGEYQEQEISNLVEKLAADINREPQNPTFIFSGGRVQEFSPAKEGIHLNEELLKNMIIGNLRTLESTDQKNLAFDIPFETTPPEIKTEEINNLGIKELIGRGSSRFRGSISSRIHNIALSASKFNGVLVAPGETFSFNNTLGDVSLYTGYKQAYIIKDGKTVLGDGGGVCQVSTTLFRAILDTGLPIVERRAHSYRVGYYEQDSSVGFDATVYDPTTDLKFKNDTPGHILIQTQTNTKIASLVFEIYGTSDGRTTTTSKPVVTNVTPPPEDLYVDDPTLPEGTIKQIDWKAWGAQSWFNYQVTRGGETIYKKTFYSNYRPWQAIYLRGTAPIQ